MDFTVLPHPLCPPRRAGGARTPPVRALRASLNPACVSRPDAIADPSTSSTAAARTPPARVLRVSLNPACVSRPSATAPAAAKKPKRPRLSGDEDPTTNRPSAAHDGKENKNAPAATAAASKVGTVLRPCGRVDEAPRLPLGKTTTRLRGTAADGNAGSKAAPAPVAKKQKATPADSEIALLRPCSRGDGASRSPLGNTARVRVGAADGHAALTPAAKRKAAAPVSEPTKKRASRATASASPSPRSLDSGGTVRELLETARTATDAIRRREIARLRAASRRELDRVVRTVEFNELFIGPRDVLR